MNSQIQKIQLAIAPLREQIINHPLYANIETVEDLQVFMQYHVYAVWDFMSLLKSLQNNLTCVTVPWFPIGNADTRYLINEIVTGEESDVDANGIRKSHFEIYLDAMKECGASVKAITAFTNCMQQGHEMQRAFEASNTPKGAGKFVTHTFSVINTQKAHLQSAVFTFGREDLIPGMFLSLINDIHRTFPGTVDTFKYYLERHIEVDGDHHSHLALQMTEQLCGTNEQLWIEALDATVASLKARIQLWDAVLATIQQKKAIAA